MKYASIIPLIGGETIAMETVFGKRPEYIISYEPFHNNDKHLVEHYNNEVPYHVLDMDSHETFEQVDVVNAVCPCAGLSSLSVNPGSDKEVNDWMINTAHYVLEDMKPRVFWGENAPRLATKLGRPIIDKLREIASNTGYTMSLYKTKSIKHGLGQIRDRTFYFFWKDDKIPMFEYYDKPRERIEDTIRAVNNIEGDPMSEVVNKKTPSKDDLYYRYILEELEGGITHSEFQDKIAKDGMFTVNVMIYVEKNGGLIKFSEWLAKQGEQKLSDKVIAHHQKLSTGKNIMRRMTEIPSDYIGAFVGHLPNLLTHPDEDRYLTYREVLSIMKMPANFQLIDPKRNLNHVCQNVPVTTASHMAENIKNYLNNDIEMINSDFIIQDNKSGKIEDFKREELTKFFG
jgi:site-specific DNA-cytosine methylase